MLGAIHRLKIAVPATFVVLAGGLMLAAAPALASGVTPTVEGLAAPSVTPFEARLEATVNPQNVETTECRFFYGTTTAYGSQAACEQGEVLGGEAQGVGVSLTGLKPGTPYYYKLVVENTESNQAEAAGEFTTSTLEKPIVESESTSGVTASAATLEAQVNPNYQGTTYAFQYATNKALTGATTVDGGGELEGFGGQPVSVPVTGLEAGANYYYRVVAKNETGTEDGAVQSFTTMPTPFTDAPENVTGTGALFKGHFTLTPQDTKYSFDYAKGSTSCEGENSTPTIDAGTGVSEVSEGWEVPSAENPGVYASAPALYPDTAYTVCFVTSNAFGSSIGPEEHFTTPVTPPAIDSESVADLSSSNPGATLQARISPYLQETPYSFEYANAEALIGTANATTAKGTNPLPAELAELTASAEIHNLQPNTTYYYRVVAENATPLVADGPVQSFVMFPNPPLTGEASEVTMTTANIAGTIDPGADGQPAGHDTSYYFQYGQDEGYGQQTPTGSAGEGPATVTETATLSGLIPGRTYHYRIVASNEDNGTAQFVYGQGKTFTTTATPSEPEQVSVPPTETVTIAPVESSFPNLTAIVPIPAPKETTSTGAGTGTKSLTKAQKLSKALKACHKKKGAKRSACEKQARRRYGATKKKSR